MNKKAEIITIIEQLRLVLSERLMAIRQKELTAELVSSRGVPPLPIPQADSNKEVRAARTLAGTSAATGSENSKNYSRMLFSKDVFLSELTDAHELAREQLTEIFGRAELWDSANGGYATDLFTYQDTGSGFAEGILVSHYEPVGEEFDKVAGEIDKRFRAEVFMKGSRWSILKRKRVFYKYLEAIGDVLDTPMRPVDYLVRNAKHSRLTISTGLPSTATPNGQIVEIGSEKGHLGIPHILEQGPAPWKDNLRHCTTFWEAVFKGKASGVLPTRDLFGAALQQFQELPQHLLNPFKEHIRSLLHHGAAMDDQGPLSAVSLFNLITLYHCYDAPYVIHLFRSEASTMGSPRPPENRGAEASLTETDETEMFLSPKAVIALTLPVGKQISIEGSNVMTELCSVVGLICDIEAALSEKRRLHIEYFWRLERVFTKDARRLERLIESVRLMLRASCDKAGILTHSITGRPKTAESLFNKLCKRANDRKRNEAARNKWRDVVTKTDIKTIRESLSDLAGVRVVCVFHEDVELVKILVEQLVQRNDLTGWKDGKETTITNSDGTTTKTVVWDEKGTYEDGDEGLIVKGYRAVHTDIVLGTGRLKLIECEDLGALICELQIKSAVASAWAEASHRISYKPEIAENKFRASDDGKKLKREMARAAAILETGDITMNNALAAYENLTGK